MAAGADRSVALIGWGRMGGPIGERLLAAGFGVTMFDVSGAARQRAADAGASVANSPAEAAVEATVIITMLPDDTAVDEAARGEQGVLAGVRPGDLWIEMSSSHPQVTAALHAEATRRRAELLDAPVTGGVPRARSGTLTVIAAGADGAFERARPLLDHLAEHLFLVGEEPGMGDIVKTINNLASATNLLIAAEGMAIAERSGIAPERLLDVLNAGTGQSNATSWKIPQYVLPNRFDSGFTVDQYLKDLRIAARVADDYSLDLPLAACATALWGDLSRDGSGSEDHTRAVALSIARALGLPASNPPRADVIAPGDD